MGKLVDLITHPDELAAALQLKFVRSPLHPRNLKKESKDLRRCYELLDITSRSFAAVIKELHPELRNAVMLFYVILRGLDTIEDDTSLDNARKVPILRDFKKVLDTEDWTFHEVSDKERDRVVLVEFDAVLREFHKLRPAYQEVIADITDKMGNGMADYIEKFSQKNYDGLKTVKDYDQYCYYVAGIVGEGLTRLAVLAGFASKTLIDRPELYISMGLFLQKTNIIRDYREDLDDGRSFWPKEIWGKYAEHLGEFAQAKDKNNVAGIENACHCVSDLAVLSLRHVVDCLEYLSLVTEPSLFSFCAIPQTMSIATVDLVFNNPLIFSENVKLRKGLAAKLILGSQTMAGVLDIFLEYTRSIHHQNKLSDPNFLAIEVQCGHIEQYIDKLSETSGGAVQRAYNKELAKRSPETERLEFRLMLAGAGMLLLTGGLMAFIAWINGARFDILFEELGHVYNKFFHDIEIPVKLHLPLDL